MSRARPTQYFTLVCFVITGRLAATCPLEPAPLARSPHGPAGTWQGGLGAGVLKILEQNRPVPNAARASCDALSIPAHGVPPHPRVPRPGAGGRLSPQPAPQAAPSALRDSLPLSPLNRPYDLLDFSTAACSCLTGVPSRFKAAAGRIKVKTAWTVSYRLGGTWVPALQALGTNSGSLSLAAAARGSRPLAGVNKNRS